MMLDAMIQRIKQFDAHMARFSTTLGLNLSAHIAAAAVPKELESYGPCVLARTVQRLERDMKHTMRSLVRSLIPSFNPQICNQPLARRSSYIIVHHHHRASSCINNQQQSTTTTTTDTEAVQDARRLPHPQLRRADVHDAALLAAAVRGRGEPAVGGAVPARPSRGPPPALIAFRCSHRRCRAIAGAAVGDAAPSATIVPGLFIYLFIYLFITPVVLQLVIISIIIMILKDHMNAI